MFRNVQSMDPIRLMTARVDAPKKMNLISEQEETDAIHH